jgi:hypothetical protein
MPELTYAIGVALAVLVIALVAIWRFSTLDLLVSFLFFRIEIRGRSRDRH